MATEAGRHMGRLRLATENGALLNGAGDRAPRYRTFLAGKIRLNDGRFVLCVIRDMSKSGARLSHLTYTQGTPGIDLTEISMEASISGEYPQMMRFVNGLERDQIFFVIRAMSLNGQQSGQANLRLRVSTWLRTADAAASGLPMTRSQAGAPASATGREGN